MEKDLWLHRGREKGHVRRLTGSWILIVFLLSLPRDQAIILRDKLHLLSRTERYLEIKRRPPKLKVFLISKDVQPTKKHQPSPRHGYTILQLYKQRPWLSNSFRKEHKKDWESFTWTQISLEKTRVLFTLEECTFYTSALILEILI